MSVITVQKPDREIAGMVMDRDDLKLVVLGCDKCAKTNRTGGTEQVRAMRERYEKSGTMILAPENLPDAVEEGLCDPKAAKERTEPLRFH